MDWERLFESRIIDRGFDYFINDYVHDVKIDYNKITSLVDGSYGNEYEVEITFDNDDIMLMDCTCPYAYTDNCKHMAATLYLYEDILEDASFDLEHDDFNSRRELINALDNVDEKTLKNYIIDKFGDDKKFVEEFSHKFQPKASVKTFQQYKNRLNEVLDINSQKSGFDDSYKNGSINLVLHEFIKNKLSVLYNNNQYEYVQKLINIIYERIALIDDAHEYIDIDSVLHECNSYMADVIDSQDSKAKDETYDYFMKNLQHKYNKYTASYILSLCLMCYTNKTYQKRTLNAINNIIKENNDIPPKLFEIKCELMIDLDYLYEDIKEELFEYRESSIIRDRLIESAMKEKKYNDAIVLLEECSDLWMERDLLKDANTLLDLYKKVGNKEKCKENIKIIVFDYEVYEIKYIDQLKKLCTIDEWEEELKDIESICKDMKCTDFINKIYIHYKRYEDLYKNVINNCPIEDIYKYRKYYQEKHIDDMFSIYKKTIFEEIKTARTRKAYDRILGYLKVMLKYENGKDVVETVVCILKYDDNNKGKKVFLEELEKFEKSLDI